MECLENIGLTMTIWNDSIQEDLVKLHQVKCMQKLITYCLRLTVNDGVELSHISKFIYEMKFLENLELYFEEGIEDLNDEEF